MPVDEQGVQLGRFQVIPRTLIFIVDHQNRVLLLKGAANKRLWANRYNGIGGHIEAGEDVLSSARRELLEETGLLVPELRLVGTVFVDTQQSVGIGIFVFLGKFRGGEIVPSEEGALEWVEADKIGSFPLVEDLYILLPRVLDFQSGDVPFSARYDYDDQGKLRILFGC